MDWFSHCNLVIYLCNDENEWQNEKKWSKWIKSGVTWASFFTTEWDIKQIYHTHSFYYYMHECSKRTCFHLSLKYIFFFTFSSIYFLIMFFTWHTILAKINKYILQFSAVVICDNQYDAFLFFNCIKNSSHLKIMVPGLQGPAGGPCKSEDITGWGLMAILLQKRKALYAVFHFLQIIFRFKST